MSPFLFHNFFTISTIFMVYLLLPVVMTFLPNFVYLSTSNKYHIFLSNEEEASAKDLCTFFYHFIFVVPLRFLSNEEEASAKDLCTFPWTLFHPADALPVVALKHCTSKMST